MVEVVAVNVITVFALILQMVEAEHGVEFPALVRREQLVHGRPGARRFADGERVAERAASQFPQELMQSLAVEIMLNAFKAQ